MADAWRIRMKYEQEFLEPAIWSKNRVGIWYGAWTAADLRLALQQPNPVGHLSGIPNQQALGWQMKPEFMNTIRRFVTIPNDDWVWCCFGGAIHFAHVDGNLADDPEFNRGGELFKYRTINEQKSFPLNELPDAYLLFSSAGRSNVYKLNGLKPLVDLLVVSRGHLELKKRISELTVRDRLALFGPSAWEALCEAYLIRREGFVPTGLRTGGTLALFDIVGRDRGGRRVLAQCKKDPVPRAIEPAFLEACSQFPGCRMLYFAFAGCTASSPDVAVITSAEIVKWLDGDEEYRRWLLGKDAESGS